MAVTQNTYTGNGSTVLYSFTFPYLETTDIKVSVNGTVTTAYTLANATTIQFNTAPANGAAIRIYRQTDDSALAATFYPGSAIRSQDLNENFTQNLYVTQESTNNAATATTTANTALTNSTTAIGTANTALSTANTASSNASAAVATANTASSNASAAVSTANTASSNATTAVNTANAATATANSAASDAATALSTANAATSTANAASTAATNAVNTANAASSAASSAVSTANTASTNASNAVTTANTASSSATTAVNTANSAVATANSAAAAVANAVIYTIVANVAAIPATPSNNTAIEVANSTGIESFTPLAGKPGGFVGNSGLSVRIIYSTSGSTWNWVQYFPNDPEARYLKLAGGTLTGALLADDSTSVASPVIAFDGDTNTGIAHTGADELALVTGGSARLTIDGSGNVAVPGTLGVTGAITGSLTGSASLNVLKAGDTMTGSLTAPALIPSGSTVPTNGLYLPSAGSVAISTGGSGRLFVDASGSVGIGKLPAYALDVSGQMQLTNNGYYRCINTTGGSVRLIGLGADNNIYIGQESTGFTSFFANGFERLRITSAGLVGVGTSSPSPYQLYVNTTGAYSAVFQTNTDQSSNSAARRISLTAQNFRPTIQGELLSSGWVATDLLLNPSGGNVGIGTTSPTYKLHVVDSVNEGVILQVLNNYSGAGTGNNAIVSCANTNNYFNMQLLGQQNFALLATNSQYTLYRSPLHIFQNSAGTTEYGRFDGSGRLLVGTSSAFNLSGGYARGFYNCATSGLGAFVRFSADANGPDIALAKSRNASTGSHTIVNNGDVLGSVSYEGSDGTSFIKGAEISAWVDGTPGANAMPGRIVLSTTAAGASSPTERMRIKENGYVGVNCTPTRRFEVIDSRANEFASVITNQDAAGHAMSLACNNNNTTAKYLDGYSSSAGSSRVIIFSNGNIQNANNSYAGISDVKLKENIADANSQWDDIKAVQVRNYNLKTDPDHRQIGVVAQEIEQVSPGLVYESPDRDAEGNDLGTVTKSVNYSVLYMKAVKALQEAMERIEALEAKVAALESA